MSEKVLIGNVRGPQGDIGPQGDPGPQGERGLDGANVLPTSEAVAQAVTEPGPAKDALSATIASAPAVTAKASSADVAASYTRKRRDQFATRRARGGRVTRVTFPTTGGVSGSGFGWTNAPIRIFKDGKRYITDFNVAAFKNTDPSTIYVDPVGGNNANNGSTPVLAKKTINAGVTAVSAGGTVIVLGTGIVYRGDAFNGTAITKSVNIIADQPGKIACAMSDNLTWTAATGNTFTASRSNVSAVVDLGVGEHGIRYTEAASAAICQATPGSWFQDGSTLHMHTLAGTQPNNQQHLALLKVQGWTFTASTAMAVYIEGIDIIGGELSGNITINGTETIDLYLKNLRLLHATEATQNTLNAIGSNVRNVFSQGVTAHGSRKDGFNYSGANCRFIEVDCHSYVHGLHAPSSSTTNNATTAHAGAKGIRVGGVYHETTGAVIADVQSGTESLNYSCVAYDPLSGTADLYDSAFCAQQAGASMWAYGCQFFGSGGWDSVALAGTSVVLDECSFDTRTGASYTTVTNEV